MMFQLDDAPRKGALMRVIGVGGAGGNAVNRMIDENLEGVEFISANTDAQALAMSRAENVIQLGKKLTRGLGAGARPGIGRQAVAEDSDEVRRLLDGADLIFIAAGMGGGTGTGAAPVIGEMARELGALTIAVVTKPFSFEGKKRMRQADQGLAELRRTVDTTVVVPNDRLLSVVGKGTSFQDALKKADEVLLHATQGISDLIRVSGEVNVDFADVRTVMSSCGAALMGTGVGQGENRALTAAQDAVTSPLLDNVSIRGAKGVLINITGGSDLAIDEVTDISTMIQEEAGDDAEIIFGAVQDSAMEGEIRVTLIATGFDDAERRTKPMISPQFGFQEEARGVGDARQVMPRAVGDTGQTRMVERSPLAAPRPARQPARMQTPAPTPFRAPLESNAAAPGGPVSRSGGIGSTAVSRTPMPRAVSREGSAHGRTRDMFGVRELELPTFIRRFNA
ncbi:MAG: cell division protein FtsZ [Gemmatimonadota bacterium]|nr:cell division protein FtsZ [Gemmatimonadota bacterium]MDE2865255.1 cell division protein FtsZ [Gemmatimonadota bacterium]